MCEAGLEEPIFWQPCMLARNARGTALQPCPYLGRCAPSPHPYTQPSYCCAGFGLPLALCLH